VPKYKFSLPLITDDDDDKWKEAVARLRQLKVRFWRPNPYQLKIGAVSYYPGKGTIHIDGDKRSFPEHGLRALELLLTKGKSASGSGKSNAKPQPGPAADSPIIINEPDLIIEEPEAQPPVLITGRAGDRE
jgi:hypothetical protein